MRTLTDTATEIQTERLVDILGATELQVMTSYTLADAIREGAQGSRQLHGGWYDADSACALSAGYLAAKARGWLA